MCSLKNKTTTTKKHLNIYLFSFHLIPPITTPSRALYKRPKHIQFNNPIQIIVIVYVEIFQERHSVSPTSTHHSTQWFRGWDWQEIKQHTLYLPLDSTVYKTVCSTCCQLTAPSYARKPLSIVKMPTSLL